LRPPTGLSPVYLHLACALVFASGGLSTPMGVTGRASPALPGDAQWPPSPSELIAGDWYLRHPGLVGASRLALACRAHSGPAHLHQVVPRPTPFPAVHCRALAYSKRIYLVSRLSL
jgi:hypothetical protein